MTRKYIPIGVDRNRYMELYYRVRRYDTLDAKERGKIDAAMEKIQKGRTGKRMLRAIIDGVPYKCLDIPYSEREYSRIKRRFYEELDKTVK